MSYAEITDVDARLGKLKAALSQDSSPSRGDAERLLEQVSDELDAYIGSAGFDVPLASDSAGYKALTALVADTVAAQIVVGLFPNEEGPAAAKALLRTLEARSLGGWKLIQNGTHPAVLVIEAGGGGTSADDFWSAEPNYGATDWVDPQPNPSLAPAITRDEVF